jgi:hypothetical protein
MNYFEIITQSFEQWYNTHVSQKTSIVINYSDEQTLVTKAYHKATITLVAIGIKDNLSYTVPLFTISENYNHGVTTEEEAKDSLTCKLLSEILDYCGKKKIN